MYILMRNLETKFVLVFSNITGLVINPLYDQVPLNSVYNYYVILCVCVGCVGGDHGQGETLGFPSLFWYICGISYA
jgi:hypothetical protein